MFELGNLVLGCLCLIRRAKAQPHPQWQCWLLRSHMYYVAWAQSIAVLKQRKSGEQVNAWCFHNSGLAWRRSPMLATAGQGLF